MTCYVIDTETNGAEQPEVIELAWLRWGGGEQGAQRFKPTVPSNWGALAVHHILPEELEGLPPPGEASLPADVQYIIGHNIDYDWGALGKPSVKRICTLAIARKLFPSLDSHKLGALYYYFFGANTVSRDMLRDAHSALADVTMCYEILKQMLDQKMPALDAGNPELLWRFSEECRIPDIITFGKHRGTRIYQLPRDYMTWMLRQPDMDPYVLQAVGRVMGRR